ncbi:unnamed protein product [Protopolystoma xenopodis]|uniref:Uncharacterized protein n=1 Tax=Protopolystoma xenopodis TaxID=117903 RepID=A0A448WV25_9PLAT|nr:unnamed protein product [Protopolystoma xenopodis]
MKEGTRADKPRPIDLHTGSSAGLPSPPCPAALADIYAEIELLATRTRDLHFGMLSAWPRRGVRSISESAPASLPPPWASGLEGRGARMTLATATAANRVKQSRALPTSSGSGSGSGSGSASGSSPAAAAGASEAGVWRIDGAARSGRNLRPARLHSSSAAGPVGANSAGPLWSPQPTIGALQEAVNILTSKFPPLSTHQWPPLLGRLLLHATLLSVATAQPIRLSCSLLLTTFFQLQLNLLRPHLFVELTCVSSESVA